MFDNTRPEGPRLIAPGIAPQVTLLKAGRIPEIDAVPRPISQENTANNLGDWCDGEAGGPAFVFGNTRPEGPRLIVPGIGPQVHCSKPATPPEIDAVPHPISQEKH